MDKVAEKNALKKEADAAVKSTGTFIIIIIIIIIIITITIIIIIIVIIIIIIIIIIITITIIIITIIIITIIVIILIIIIIIIIIITGKNAKELEERMKSGEIAGEQDFSVDPYEPHPDFRFCKVVINLFYFL
jgi:energy-coupling factor transporter transmembrane protein EcfT